MVLLVGKDTNFSCSQFYVSDKLLVLEFFLDNEYAANIKKNLTKK